jgi:predicted Zn-dependent protease
MGRWAQRAALARSPPDTATAVEVGARAAALHPGSAVALTAAGRAAAAADDAEGARARLQAALALDPAHAPAMLALAQVAEASGAPEREVEAWFLAAVEADEDSPAPRVAWAAMLQRRPPPAPPALSLAPSRLQRLSRAWWCGGRELRGWARRAHA